MSHRTFRAPGKLVWLGEYAVLDGAPALVVAVDRGVQCTVTLGGGEAHVETPGDDRFARAALGAGNAPPGRWAFSAWNPVELAGKPGFGGSAAATVVALLAAWSCQGRSPPPEALEDRARQVHTQVQGSGSGVDVAAAAHGGVLRFQPGARPQVQPGPPQVRRWFAEDRVAVIWSGQPARTGPRVEAYLQWSGRAAFTRASAALVQQLGQAPFEILREARARLSEMAKAAGIAYDTPAHDRIAALADRFGGAAKPSGAGGGDCAVALLPDRQARARFVQACEEEGFVFIPVRLAPGAHQENP